MRIQCFIVNIYYMTIYISFIIVRKRLQYNYIKRSGIKLEYGLNYKNQIKQVGWFYCIRMVLESDRQPQNPGSDLVCVGKT